MGGHPPPKLFGSFCSELGEAESLIIAAPSLLAGGLMSGAERPQPASSSGTAAKAGAKAKAKAKPAAGEKAIKEKEKNTLQIDNLRCLTHR